MKFFTKGDSRNFEWEGEVRSLCTYANGNGSGTRFWVGECEEGFFYGCAHHLVGTKSLCHCFRWAAPFSTKEEAIKNSDLRICRGEPVPDYIAVQIAKAASFFYAKPALRRKKEYDLPFEL